MKIYSISVFLLSEDKTSLLADALNYDGIGFFYKSNYQELTRFATATCAARIKNTTYISITYKDFVCHARVLPSGLIFTALTDKEYPDRIAFALIEEALQVFNQSSNPASWKKMAESPVTIPGFDDLMIKYKNPVETDKILKIQVELAETKEIVKKTIDQLLERDENLNKLVEKSNSLSFQSKAFANNARKLNSCCGV